MAGTGLVGRVGDQAGHRHHDDQHQQAGPEKRRQPRAAQRAAPEARPKRARRRLGHQPPDPLERALAHASSRSTRLMSRTARALPPHAARDLGPPAGAEAVGDRSLADPPARRGRAQHHLQRPAEGAILQAELGQRLARGRSASARGRRSATGSGGAAAARARGWPAGRAAARRRARRGASRGTDRAGRLRPARSPAGARAGSSDPSQSMKQTSSERAADSPAKQAAPKPRRGSETTWAPIRRATSAEPSVEPLSTTSGVEPSRERRQHDRDRLGLVEHGKDDLHHSGESTPRFLRLEKPRSRGGLKPVPTA